MSAFTWSQFQLDIFSRLSDPQGGNLCVIAGAGAAKTTTIVESLKIIPHRDAGGFLPPSTVFLAFNKSIADALKSKCPAHVQCATFHALTLRAMKRIAGPAGKAKDYVDKDKCRKLVYSYVDRQDPDTQSILRLVSLTKSKAIPPEDWTEKDILDLSARFGFSLEEPRSAASVVQKVITRSFKERDHIDFDDMLYMSVMLNAPFDKQDWIFVDEAQDTNDIQVDVVERLMHSSSRLCVVGDPAQAIYGFRGANSDSMDKIAERFACVQMPLSVSYRCSHAVVEEANKILAKETL